MYLAASLNQPASFLSAHVLPTEVKTAGGDQSLPENVSFQRYIIIHFKQTGDVTLQLTASTLLCLSPE